MHGLTAPFINFLLLVALLVWKLRGPVKNFVAQRHNTLRNDIDTVRESLKRAQERYNEFSAKLKSVDQELIALRQQSRQDAEAMRVRVVADAKKLATTVVTDARASSENVFQELRGQLRAELGVRVIERAERILRDRLTGDDRVRIRNEFSKQVEAIQ